MKRSSISKLFSGLLIAAATLLLLTSCSGVDETPEAVDRISDYFPIKINSYYEYESSPTTSGNQQVYVAYADNGRIQRRITSSVLETTEVLDLRDGELRLVYYEPQFYYLENILTVTPTEDMLLIKEPLAVGNKWKMNADADCEITSMDVPIETKYGSNQAMEITISYANGNVEQQYYVKGVGLVKTTYDSGNVSIALANIRESVSLDIPVVYYYLSDAAENGIDKEIRIVKFSTNTVLSKMLEQTMRTSGEGEPILSEGAAINVIEIDRSTDMLYLDMSEGFESGMSADPDVEDKTLQCIANTLGNFYDVERVLVSVDGREYKSANKHITAGDYIEVEKFVSEDVAGAEEEEL